MLFWVTDLINLYRRILKENDNAGESFIISNYHEVLTF